MSDPGQHRPHRRELLGLVQGFALATELGLGPLALRHVAHDGRQELDGAVRSAMGDGDDRHGHLAFVPGQQNCFARPEAVPEQGRQDLVVDDGAQPIWCQACDRVAERLVGCQPEQRLPCGVEVQQAAGEVRDRDQVGGRFQDRGEPLSRLELLAQATVETRVLDGDRGMVGERQQEPLLDGGELARASAADRQDGHQAFGPDERRRERLSRVPEDRRRVWFTGLGEEMPHGDPPLESQPLREILGHREPQRLGGAVIDPLPGDRPQHAGLEEPQDARLDLEELAGRAHDPAQDLVEILDRDERLREIVEHGQAVLLVGEAAMGEDVLDRRGKLGEIPLALDEIVRDAELEGLDGGVLVALAGHHHDRDPDALGLELLEHLDPREIRQPVVQKQDVVMSGLQPGERLPGTGDRLDAGAAVVLVEGAERERHVFGMMLGVEEADRCPPELARRAKPATRTLEHDRKRGQILRALHEVVGRARFEKAHRHVGVARTGHQHDRHFQASRFDRVEQVQRRPVRKAIAREQHVHVADRDAFERLGDGARDGQLDVRRVTREVTMRQLLIDRIVFHIEHADGIHGVFNPLVP